MFTRTLPLFAIATALLAAAPRAEAGTDAGGMSLLRQAIAACRADAQKLCPDVLPGGGRIAACLVLHTNALEPACSEALTKTRTAISQIVRDAVPACLADAQKYCANVPPGEGRIAVCLGQHTDALEPVCQDVVRQARSVFGN